MKTVILAAASLAALATATPALAAPGDPVKVSDTVTIDPIVEGRLRYEGVDQDQLDRTADALTMRLRAGAEVKAGALSLLVEGEGTLAIVNDYNAFPFATASNQSRPAYSVVADPETVEVNRLQLQYKTAAVTLTGGRQRIALDDQRWVGNVGWRQNEQTFDAVRGEAKLGPVMLDATYSWGQRTIFGVDAGPRQAYDGDFVFAGAGVKAGPVTVKGFAYLLDYDEDPVRLSSSQTYGVRATGAVPLSATAKAAFAASYARQMDWKDNPLDYAADYLSGDAAVTVSGVTLSGGWEHLGSDDGVAAVQTPLATLHKFNGWADLFLATPAAGLEDAWGGVAYKFAALKALPDLTAGVTFHQFDSAAGDLEYGTEWDASLGFKLGRVALLAKYADYSAKGFGTDTTKLWLQAEFAY